MPDVLPRRYRAAHDIAVDFHDIAVHLIQDGTRHRLFNTRIVFKSEADVESYGLIQSGEVIEWLEQRGYKKELYLIALKEISRALIIDFCHFVLEGLNNVEKGKITVAWTLFRKAFKDNLFYLEWMLAYPIEFLDRFHNEGPKSIDVSNRKSVPESKIIEIIFRAIENTRHPEWASAEFLYNLRYSKQHTEGLESVWNKASHLITGAARYATEHRNFNFVFSGDKELEAQWEHIYYYIPFLLYHAVLVIEASLARFTGADKNLNLVADYHRDAGFYLWSRDIGFPRTDGVCVHPKILVDELPILECPHCSGSIRPTVRQLKRLYYESALRCKKCRNDVDLLAIHFDRVKVPDPRGEEPSRRSKSAKSVP